MFERKRSPWRCDQKLTKYSMVCYSFFWKAIANHPGRFQICTSGPKYRRWREQFTSVVSRIEFFVRVIWMAGKNHLSAGIFYDSPRGIFLCNTSIVFHQKECWTIIYLVPLCFKIIQNEGHILIRFCWSQWSCMGSLHYLQPTGGPGKISHTIKTKNTLQAAIN